MKPQISAEVVVVGKRTNKQQKPKGKKGRSRPVSLRSKPFKKNSCHSSNAVMSLASDTGGSKSLQREEYLSRTRTRDVERGKGKAQGHTGKTQKEAIVGSSKGVDDNLIPCLRQTAKRRKVILEQKEEDYSSSSLVRQMNTKISPSSMSCPSVKKRGSHGEKSGVADSSRKRKKCQYLRVGESTRVEFSERDKEKNASCQLQGTKSGNIYKEQNCNKLRLKRRMSGVDISTPSLLTNQQGIVEDYSISKGEGVVQTFSKSKWLYASKHTLKKGKGVEFHLPDRRGGFIKPSATEDGEQGKLIVSTQSQQWRKNREKVDRKIKKSPWAETSQSKILARFPKSSCSIRKSGKNIDCKSCSYKERELSLASSPQFTARGVSKNRPAMKVSRNHCSFAQDYRYPSTSQTLPGLESSGITQQHRMDRALEEVEEEEVEETRKKSSKRKGRKKKNRQPVDFNASQCRSSDPGKETEGREKEGKLVMKRKEIGWEKGGRKEGTSFPVTYSPVFPLLQSGTVLKGICKRPGTPVPTAAKQKKRVRL